MTYRCMLAIMRVHGEVEIASREEPREDERETEWESNIHNTNTRVHGGEYQVTKGGEKNTL